MMGYIVRSKAEGWMQGFITVTAFTTWQKYFTWDSLAHEAQVLEDKDDDPESVCDVTGLLARELAAQIHDGDPDGEGVIWPRIAEVSLLGALGCGGWLLKLMLEELEAASSPYEYVILQASENSIRFYEHHGFTRVGALARYEDDELLNREREAKAEAAGLPKGAVPQGRPVREMVRTSSPTTMAEAKDSETPQQLATRLKLKLFDIIFLNTHLYPNLTSSSKLKAGTQLRVPVVKPPPQERTDGLPPVYLADENETPRQIANKLGVDPKELVKLNKRFLKGLTQHSRLKSNSKLRVPGANGETPDAEDWTLFGDVVGYRHWTFPDETEGAYAPFAHLCICAALRNLSRHLMLRVAAQDLQHRSELHDGQEAQPEGQGPGPRGARAGQPCRRPGRACGHRRTADESHSLRHRHHERRTARRGQAGAGSRRSRRGVRG